MSAKRKYESIDRSKLNKDVLRLLDLMKKKTDNFENEEVIKASKVEGALDRLITKYPDAVKKSSPKSKSKAKAKQPAKSKPKRETVMTVAKRIRKEGEKWQDALKRAKSEMGKETEKSKTAVETEMGKLQKLISKDSILKGFNKSDLQRDAVRKAKPRGKRKTSTKGETTNQYGTYKNKVGRPYWESRENRSDRYAPSFPKNKPFLEDGGLILGGSTTLRDNGDIMPLGTANADAVFEAGGVTGQTVVNPNEAMADLTSTYGFDDVYAKGGRIEELDTELGELEATYDVEDEEYKKLIMQDIISINEELDKLGGGQYKSDYPNDNKMAKGGEVKNGVYEYIELKGTRFEKNRGYTIRADKWNDLIEKGVLDSNDINLADDWRTAIKEENWGKYTRKMYSPKLDRLREQTENEFYNNKLYSKGGEITSQEHIKELRRIFNAKNGSEEDVRYEMFRYLQPMDKTKIVGGEYENPLFEIADELYIDYDRDVDHDEVNSKILNSIENSYAKGGRIEELDTELGELEATYDVEDEEYKKLIMQDIISINEELDKLGGGQYKSDYPNDNKMAKGGKTQGYNDRLNESLGNRDGAEDMMMQSYKDRRDESKGMEKSMGRRAYQSVGTMDRNNDPNDLYGAFEKGGELILGGATTLRDNGDIMQLGIANSDAVFKHGGAINEMRKEKDVDIYEEQMAKGGKTQGQTLAENFNLKDEVKNVEFWKNDVIVEDKNGKVARIDLDKGERIELNAKGGEVLSLRQDDDRPFLVFLDKEPSSEKGKKIYNKQGFYIDTQMGFNGLITSYFKDKETLIENLNPKYRSQIMAKGGIVKKYKVGDMWSEDFDYEGMLMYGKKINDKTSMKDIEKYAESLEDVNYHTLAKPLFDYDVAVSKDKDKKRYFLANFKRKLSDELQNQGYNRLEMNEIYNFKKGGEIDAFTMSMIKGSGDITELETKDAKINMAKGGKIGFDGLAKKVAKNYSGKKVPKKFQNQYGKTYSPAEAKEVGDKVAGAVYRMQQAKKMAKGGELSMESYWDEMIKTNLDRIKRIDKIRNQPISKLKEDKFNKNKSSKEIVDYLSELKKLRAVYKADNNKLISNFGGVKKYSEYLRKEKNENTLPFAKGGKTQGYNDKLNESLGDTKGKRSTKEQDYKDRRNESEAMEKKEGKRKYSRVKTMDKGSRKLKKPNSFFAVVKRKQKKGEAWKDAIQRVKNEMKK